MIYDMLYSIYYISYMKCQILYCIYCTFYSIQFNLILYNILYYTIYYIILYYTFYYIILYIIFYYIIVYYTIHSILFFSVHLYYIILYIIYYIYRKGRHQGPQITYLQFCWFLVIFFFILAVVNEFYWKDMYICLHFIKDMYLFI